MIRKDYLVKQFEEFGKFMAIILGFRQNERWLEHEQKVLEAMKQFTALELLSIEDLPNEQFFEHLRSKAPLNEDQLKITADLLFEKAHYYLHQNENINASNALQKANILYRHLVQTGSGINFSLDNHFKLSSIERILAQLD